MSMDFDYWASKAREENPDFLEQTKEESGESEMPVVTEVSQLIGDDASNMALPISDDASNMALPISDDAVIAEPSVLNDVPVVEEVILNEQSDETRKESQAGSICKAIFLGVPIGIPVFVVMLVFFGSLVAAACVLFGVMVMATVLLCLGGLASVLLGISYVHVLFAPSLLMIGIGLFSVSVGIFLALITRLEFKYILLGLIKCFELPVKFIKLFFCKKKKTDDLMAGKEMIA